jgi:hypothetical protein
MRYTPLVLGDVNGDGRFDDRAYVPSPGSGDSSFSNGIARLLASAPSGARACLLRAVGSFAERNGCTGPWTTSLDAELYTPLGVVSSHRVTLDVEVLNAISGLDALLHGENKMRGWGGYGMADNTLLTETGYDGAQQRFSYAVNPAFGSVRSRSAMENPFGIRVGVSMTLSRDRAEQQLTIDASRRQHPTVANLTDRYVADYPNVGFDILDVADSVGLTKPQRDSLTVIGREFDATMRTIWAPVAERIHGGLTPEASSQIIKAARTPAAINYDAYADQVRKLLNASQLARLPEMEKWIIEPDALRSMGLAPNAVAR